MSWFFDDANNTEKEVANILLELPSLIINNPADPGWGFKGRRSARRTTAPPRHRRPPHQFSPIPAADHGVASQLGTSSCSGESDDEKTVTDDQRIPFIEENSSEIKAQPSGLEPISTAPAYIPKGKGKRIKFKTPRPENSPQVRHAGQSRQIINDEPPSPKEDVYPDVMVMESKKKTSDKSATEEFEEGMTEPAVLSEGRLVGGSRKIKAKPTTMLEANPSIPHKKPAKRKSQQEMENEVMFWEQNKRAFLESIGKVKDYLEKQKALNLQLKARKLQLFSIKAKSDSG